MTKIISALIVVLVSSQSFAAEKTREPASNIPDAVTKLAYKVERETRSRISMYVVAPKDANPCSDAGVHYSVEVQVKKAGRTMGKDGNITVGYSWETVRKIDTDAQGRPKICLE